MGQEDMSLKEYVKDIHHYADLWNGAVFHGRQLVQAEELVPEYPLHLVNLASLEHTEHFQTELRIVMDLYRLKEDKEGWRAKRLSNRLHLPTFYNFVTFS